MKIRDTSKPARRIDPQELARRLGADVVIELPDVGDGPIGMAARARWFSKRQAAIRRGMEEAGFKPGDHVRIWSKDVEMSVAGRVRWFQLEPARSVVIDCVDGRARTLAMDRIERIVNFGAVAELPRVGRYKGHDWWKEKKDER